MPAYFCARVDGWANQPSWGVGAYRGFGALTPRPLTVMGGYLFPAAVTKPEVFPHKHKCGASGHAANMTHAAFTPFPGRLPRRVQGFPSGPGGLMSSFRRTQEIRFWISVKRRIDFLCPYWAICLMQLGF